MSEDAVIPAERIEQAIYLLRGQKVMLDRDLAALYGVETKRLKEQVRRNIDRFPDDFAFVLDPQEFATLRSQFATSRRGTGILPVMFMGETPMPREIHAAEIGGKHEYGCYHNTGSARVIRAR
jgi:hypothetical protein